MNLNMTNISITKKNQKEVQNFLFKNGYIWISYSKNFYDCFHHYNLEEVRYLFIEDNIFSVRNATYGYITISGDNFLRTEKIKKLL